MADRLVDRAGAAVLRADALRLPLRDASVDLIVTSPPSDAHKVECLRPLEASLERRSHLRVTPRACPTIAPSVQERRGNEHAWPAPRSGALHNWHGALTNRLLYNGIGGAQLVRCFLHRQKRFTLDDCRYVEPSASGQFVESAYLKRVFRLGTLDPQEGKNGLQDATTRSRVDLPGVERFSVLGPRLSQEEVPSERSMEQLNRLGLDLLHRNPRRVRGHRHVGAFPQSISRAPHPDVAIAIENSCHVRQFRFCRHTPKDTAEL